MHWTFSLIKCTALLAVTTATGRSRCVACFLWRSEDSGILSIAMHLQYTWAQGSLGVWENAHTPHPCVAAYAWSLCTLCTHGLTSGIMQPHTCPHKPWERSHTQESFIDRRQHA